MIRNGKTKNFFKLEKNTLSEFPQNAAMISNSAQVS